MRNWETVLGLEIHAQLATKSKIFSGAAVRYGWPPNTQACAVDLGLPGVLPVLNAEVVRMAAMFGLAVGAQVASVSVFARKNYFYPDLPKGYQISQFELPIVVGGSVDIELDGGGSKHVRITRAHLEEDAGKSLHEEFSDSTGIDLNRAGTPLIEIVSEPDMRSGAEAVAYMKKIHSIVTYLGICDGNMQEGSFRCDANVSVRPMGNTTLGTRAEIKNLNSFRFIERAIAHEVERQIDLLENGGTVIQETRLYDPDRDETRSMRSKEEANDYRYFPDPDLLPLRITNEQIAAWRSALPELPDAKRARFESEFELSKQDASVLTSSRPLADYYEATVVASQNSDPKLCANWVTGEVLGALNRDGSGIEQCPLEPERLGDLLVRVSDGTLSGKLAKQVFTALWESHESADAIIESQGLKQVTNSTEIDALVASVLDEHPAQIEQYRTGATKLMGFFVGQVMKRSGGKANPAQVNKTLQSKLAER
ncbi:MAG: aspartyl-tRNA(Asn)/glutamyl-tRNA(Gln) amidotransferase subunit B [Gammaproteobacteria bacterium]|jgi:aspartyl-tRNA(Asn)/glutamyl-tRNA(Gln) amidotransferase subunit B